nr:MAG: capsid protein [Cressdnaviricota sp.]
MPVTPRRRLFKSALKHGGKIVANTGWLLSKKGVNKRKFKADYGKNPFANKKRRGHGRRVNPVIASGGSSVFHVIKKKYKPLKKIGGRHVKVPRRLRAQVREVIDGRQFHGVYRRVHANQMLLTGRTQNQQTVVQGFDSFGAAHVGENFVIGDIPGILDAFSVLWNLKAVDLDASKAANLPQDFGTCLSGPGLTTANFKAEILSINQEIKVRNNSLEVINVTYIKCVSRFTRVKSDPVTDWAAALAEEAPIGSSVQFPGPNIIGNGIADAYMRPYDMPSWRKQWKHEVQIAVIEPGQTTSFNQRIGRTTFDLRKWSTSANAGKTLSGLSFLKANVTTDSIFIVTPQVLPTSTASTDSCGIFYPHVANQFVTFDVHRTYKLLCPEQTLNTVLGTAAGAYSINNSTLKQDAYITRVFYGGVGAGQPVEVQPDYEPQVAP